MFMDFKQTVKVIRLIKICIAVFLFISFVLVMMGEINHKSAFKSIKSLRNKEIIYSSIDGVIIDLDYDSGVVFSKPVSVKVYARYNEAGMRFLIIGPLRKGFTFKLK